MLLGGTETTLSCWAGPVGSSFFAEICITLQTLCWSWQYQQACHFPSLFRFSFCFLHSPSSFYLTLCHIRQELPLLFSSCFIRLQLVPSCSFLSGKGTTYELAIRGSSHLLSDLISLLLPIVPTDLVSWTVDVRFIKILPHSGPLSIH